MTTLDPPRDLKMKMQALEMEAERTILEQLRAGNYEAFEQIYDRYSPKLTGNLVRLLKDRDLAAECLQEIFVRLWEHRGSIDPEKSIKAYLFRISENMVYDIFRKVARDEKMRAHFISFTTEAYDHIEKALFDQEGRQLLHEAIDKLPPQRKRVYSMCKLEEKSYKEVADLLGISQAAVNDHVTKANAFLKDYFSSHPSLPVLILASLLYNSLS
ncbi:MULTISPECIES: RNA polymerase sigma factor [Sphingobacterium]|uniref:RNA polymerase sigma factor n=1 Tax=Sphingobacterium TaxID=28453 RepID=UPI0008D1E5BC|nr:MULTISPECIES: RNA polymerase sigma-70 factor [Sphingobacterium]OFV19500.1 hypothetical protein HMPREF3127_04570 [Sphingobacterium sp. HMSC13C05]HAL54861.1 RNA polymerase sigma-70 factor [Sphingobacterium sp.]